MNDPTTLAECCCAPVKPPCWQAAAVVTPTCRFCWCSQGRDGIVKCWDVHSGSSLSRWVMAEFQSIYEFESNQWHLGDSTLWQVGMPWCPVDTVHSRPCSKAWWRLSAVQHTAGVNAHTTSQEYSMQLRPATAAAAANHITQFVFFSSLSFPLSAQLRFACHAGCAELIICHWVAARTSSQHPLPSCMFTLRTPCRLFPHVRAVIQCMSCLQVASTSAVLHFWSQARPAAAAVQNHSSNITPALPQHSLESMASLLRVQMPAVAAQMLRATQAEAAGGSRQHLTGC
jgi:hypothetical protein